MNVKVVNRSPFPLPDYKTVNSAGLDLRANIEESVILNQFERKLISTGLYIEIPKGYEAQIRPRSGLALKHGLTVLNSPGTIDADYRGEVGVILVNLSNEAYTIEPGERICQMVISSFENIRWLEVDKISETERGGGGFGHTGK